MDLMLPMWTCLRVMDPIGPSAILYGGQLRALFRGATLGWVGICHASKILLHHTVDSRDDCEHLVYIISRMQWCSFLPTVPGSLARAGAIDSARLGSLKSRILDILVTVLLHIIRLVVRYHVDQIGILIKDDPGNRKKSMERIHQAEANLQLLDEDLIQGQLEDFLSRRRKSKALDSSKELVPPKVQELLDGLHVDPRPGLSRVAREQNRAILEMYPLLDQIEEYRQFRYWNATYDKVLWITGDAGQGKSPLATSVIEDLSGRKQAGAEQSYVSFFFFDYSSPQYDNAAAAVRNLIWFVLTKQPSLSQYLEKKQETTGRKHFDHPNDFPALSSVLLDMLGDDDFPNVHYIVNALDEASYGDVSRGIDKLLDLTSTTTGHKPLKKVR
ncbi:hypothetical protein GGR52DRAFT_493168 [Hypoxylon sp. FL1284]|nr:hypothetical protein GGR52DRAFT_493168 [Hypoxylon sp. FL1284]